MVNGTHVNGISVSIFNNYGARIHLTITCNERDRSNDLSQLTTSGNRRWNRGRGRNRERGKEGERREEVRVDRKVAATANREAASGVWVLRARGGRARTAPGGEKTEGGRKEPR